MQFRWLLILIVATVAGVAHGNRSILNFDQLPACARDCRILTVAELNCIPPAAPISNNATYVDCFCQSEYLRTLHRNGNICHNVCSSEEDLIIYHHYNALCGTPDCAPSSTLLPPVSSSTSASRDRSSEPIPAPSSDPHEEAGRHITWARNNWKYLTIAAILLLITFALIFGIAIFRRRLQKKTRIERQTTRNGLIPLRLVASRARSSSRPRSHGNWPRPTTPSSDIHNIPSPHVQSPLASPASVRSFSDSLRFYADDLREQAERRTRQASGNESPTPVGFGLHRHESRTVRR